MNYIINPPGLPCYPTITLFYSHLYPAYPYNDPAYKEHPQLVQVPSAENPEPPELESLF